MQISNLGIPIRDYDSLLNLGSLTESGKKAVIEFVKANSMQGIILFGAGTTGEALREVLGKGFLRFVDSVSITGLREESFDAIFLATSPLHYGKIMATIEEVFDRQDLHVVLPFADSQDIDVHLILETQPRSGTHYTIRNLMRCLNWGYASTFKETGLAESEQSNDEHIFFVPSPEVQGYVVKSHFMKPLHYPQYRYCKILFLVSYIFDSYYSWGRMLSGNTSSANYVLKSHAKEWQILQGFIELNKQWLEYLTDKFYLRYEDYYLDFDGSLRRISKFLDERPLDHFEKPRKNAQRMYWSDAYEAHLDKDVFLRLSADFHPFISRYWPEKLDSLSLKSLTQS